MAGGGGKVLGVQITLTHSVVQIAIRCHGLWLFHCSTAVLDFRFVPVFSFGLLWPFSIRVNDCRHVGRLISVLQTVRPLLEACGASDVVLKAFNRATKPFGCVSLCNP